jgi:hypothetical protein
MPPPNKKEYLIAKYKINKKQLTILSNHSYLSLIPITHIYLTANPRNKRKVNPCIIKILTYFTTWPIILFGFVVAK